MVVVVVMVVVLMKTCNSFEGDVVGCYTLRPRMAFVLLVHCNHFSVDNAVR